MPEKTTQKTTQKILDILRKNPAMSRREIAETLGGYRMGKPRPERLIRNRVVALFTDKDRCEFFLYPILGCLSVRHSLARFLLPSSHVYGRNSATA